LTVPVTGAAAEEGRLRRSRRELDRELERLFDLHAVALRRYATALLRNPSDAEDVVQQTFLKALRAFRAGARPQQSRRWLVAIAHNECRMHFRRASRRPTEVALDLALDLTIDRSPESEAYPSLQEIREALGQLAQSQRTALVLRELEGRPYAEIAGVLDVSESAVETLLFRARRALREQLEGRDDCAGAQALLGADSLDELSRRRLRAHVRSCSACARLERSRRGRLAAAARKLGALFPCPSPLSALPGGSSAAKVVVAVAAATVVTGGAVEVAPTDGAQPRAAPAQVLRHGDPPEPAGARVAATRVVHRVPRAPPPPTKRAVAAPRSQPPPAPGVEHAPRAVAPPAAAAPPSHAPPSPPAPRPAPPPESLPPENPPPAKLLPALPAVTLPQQLPDLPTASAELPKLTAPQLQVPPPVADLAQPVSLPAIQVAVPPLPRLGVVNVTAP
jgi:RNA polymerase sigma factor (sigma-70 family)